MEQLLNKSDDNLFNSIDGLTWLPWVGKHYYENNNRLLIVGESQYGEDSPERIEELKNKNFTRECVEEQAVLREKYHVKIYSNLHQIIVGNDLFETRLLWSKISYFNFVQKAMITIGTRPEYADFDKSCVQFFAVLNHLQPNYCLVCGMGGLYAIINNMKKYNYELTTDVINYHPKISRTVPKSFTLKKDSYEVKLIFIQHPSHHFSYSKWRKFLIEQAPKLINEYNFGA